MKSVLVKHLFFCGLTKYFISKASFSTLAINCELCIITEGLVFKNIQNVLADWEYGPNKVRMRYLGGFSVALLSTKHFVCP